jgi:hypothetical protein
LVWQYITETAVTDNPITNLKRDPAILIFRYQQKRNVKFLTTTTGGNDNDLKERIKSVNKNFFHVIIKELEEEGIEYSKLPADDSLNLVEKMALKKTMLRKLLSEN